MLIPFDGPTRHVAITEDEVDGRRVVILPGRSRVEASYYISAGLMFLFFMPFVLLKDSTMEPSQRVSIYGWVILTLVVALNAGMWAAAYHWNCRSHEILRTDGRSLLIRREARPFQQSREFDLAAIYDVRHDPPEVCNFGIVAPIKREFGRGGSIAFEFGRKTFRFGRDLTTGDADRIIAWITSAKGMGG